MVVRSRVHIHITYIRVCGFDTLLSVTYSIFKNNIVVHVEYAVIVKHNNNYKQLGLTVHVCIDVEFIWFGLVHVYVHASVYVYDPSSYIRGTYLFIVL